MAEEQRMWSKRHVHESSTVGYGQFGTPTYQQSTKDWEFLRQNDSDSTSDDLSDTQDDRCEYLKIFSEPEPVATDIANEDGHDTGLLHDNLADLAPAATLIKAINKSESASISTPRRGYLIDFGSAVVLGTDGADSGNLSVPIAAFINSPAVDVLNLACLGTEQIEYAPTNDTRRSFRVPTLDSEIRTVISGTEPVLQVSFSRSNKHGNNDSFLLVRRSTHTTVFEPLLPRGNLVHPSASNASSLDPNPLVTLEISLTGGYPHVDCMFHPLNRRMLAIVDEGGHWSTWKISGRRSTTARVLYQVRLVSSGRISSWTHSKRPKGVAPYFDGWHKVVWLSSNGHSIDRLLVCNRRTIQVYDDAGHEVYSIDARLEVGKANSILDVQATAILNLCLILTSSRVLVYDLRQQEWKDPTSRKGPSLLCAFQHFHNADDISLRMTQLSLDDNVLLGLYAAASEFLEIRQLSLVSRNDRFFASVADMRSMKLPHISSWSRPAMIRLTRLEYSRTAGDELLPGNQLVNIVVQCEDGSIYSFWSIAVVSKERESEDALRCLLRLPPNRSLLSKRYADDAHDEEDALEDFVVADDVNDLSWLLPSSERLGAAIVAIQQPKELKRIHFVNDALQKQVIDATSQSAIDVHEMLEQIETRIHGLGRRKEDFKCEILPSMLRSNIAIRDIESESVTIQDAVEESNRHATGRTISRCHGDQSQTLWNVYQATFDTFIESLPADVPDRSRVLMERQDRQIALEQYLSSLIVHTVSPERVADLDEAQEAAGSSQLIFSDPFDNDTAQKQQRQSFSASQPLPVIDSEPKMLGTTTSPLVDSILRLRAYTEFRSDDYDLEMTEPARSEQILSVLSHLPTSSDEDPNLYDYHSKIMAIAAEKAETSGKGGRVSSRTQKKTARLAKARRQAEASTPAANLSTNEAYDKRDGKDSRGAQSRNQGILPIREAGARFPEVPRDIDQGQSHDRHAFVSREHMPAAESSSQAGPSYGGGTPTQPRWGTLASRVEAEGSSKQKKKRRVAGF